MRDITSIQEAFVADHIAALRSEGSALRAERERDHAREDVVDVTDASGHRFEAASRRVRIGRWLVAVGEAIAGSTRSGERSRAFLTASDGVDDPCADSGDRLVPAA